MSSRYQVKNQAFAEAKRLLDGRAFLVWLGILTAGTFLALVGAGSEVAFLDAGFALILSVGLAGLVMAALGSLRDRTAWLIIPRPPAEGHRFTHRLSDGLQLARPSGTFRPPRLFS